MTANCADREKMLHCAASPLGFHVYKSLILVHTICYTDFLNGLEDDKADSTVKPV